MGKGRSWRIVLAAGVLAGSFGVLYGLYGYVIAFQGETNDGFFLFGRQFLLEFLDHPAGLVRYVGRFLGQFSHYPWLGALLASGAITCFGALWSGVLGKVKGQWRVGQTLAPCVLLVALHTSTIYLVQDTLGLCASCLAFWVYLSFRGQGSRRWFALAATGILYWAAGSYVWLLAAWIAAYEWLDGPLGRGWWFKVGYVALSVAMPLAAWRWVYEISLSSAWSCPVWFVPPFRSGLLHYNPAHSVVDGLLAAGLVGYLWLAPLVGRGRCCTGGASGTRAGRWSWRWRAALGVGLVGLGVWFHEFRYDEPLRTVMACRRWYKAGQWESLLKEAERRPSTDIRLQFMTNYALCRQGRLLDEMFRYPQWWGPRGLVLNFSGEASLNPAEDDTYRAMYNSDLFYAMGHASAALRHVYNYLTATGESYEVLERMAECSMANGNRELAAKYLNLLDKTLFHRDFARRYQAILADPRSFEREFAEVRSQAPIREQDMSESPVAPLQMLLEAKPDNRMAFDYLMAWRLLDKSKGSLDAMCRSIEGFQKAGYASIPRHCQEAMLRSERRGASPVDWKGLVRDGAIANRVDCFIQDVSRLLSRPEAAEELQALYGDTYMFYYYFVETPADAPRPLSMQRGSGGGLRQE